jgi:DegV family protein with EDD domain
MCQAKEESMRFVMDDAGDIPEEFARQYNVTIVPVSIMFGTDEYMSRVNIDHDTFYRMVEEVDDSRFPKTSQPTPYQFSEVYRRLLAEGDDEILTVTVGHKLSGTYDSAVQAAAELEGQGTFHIFDSMAGSSVQGYMVMESARLVEQGATAAEVLARLEQIRDTMTVVFMVQSLEFAVRGGRISSLRSTVASLLNIKPILKVKDGLIVQAGTVRTYKKALNHIIDFVCERMGDRPVRLGFIHARTPEGATELAARSSERLNVVEAFEQEMSIPVAVNLGPGALGIVAIPA